MEGKIRHFFSDVFSSGKAGKIDDTLRYTVLNSIILVGGLFLIVFGIIVLISGNIPRAISDFAMAAVCFGVFFLLRTKIPLQIPGGIVVGAFGFLCAQFVQTGELGGFASLWIFIFPLMAIFVLGLKTGLVFTVLMFITVTVFTTVPGLASDVYNTNSASRLIGVYLLVSLFSVIYENSRLARDRRVESLNKEIQIERDMINAMKDNLDNGVFLMDKNFIIQGAYSKPLEDILCTDDLEGEKFTDLLSSSLKAKERETMEDYFRMVLTRQFDKKMLEEINPIAEFTYVDNVNRETKVLHSKFSTVDQGLDDYYVLGSLEDITVTKQLQMQLEAEATKRNEEMKALFQVIQVDPAVFGDFIDDTENEFEIINDILKNTEITAKEAMIHVFQSVHAIKANALILGLDNFSGKLHELENAIKILRDNEDEVTFEDVLHITVELERIMKEKDKFRDIIGKIESFRNKSGKRRQDRYVLVETLSKACEKAAESEEKKVVFIVDELEGSILEYGPRRVIKEVLTQLVRNSVVHGIETPRERESRGKDSQGHIRLSITRENDLIHLKLSDDGSGLDFNKIRNRALSLKLISEEDSKNKNALLQVIFSPGFSTADATDLQAGRGIGLNLVRERIKSLNGSIKLSSEPGKSTTFDLFIPDKEPEIAKAS